MRPGRYGVTAIVLLMLRVMSAPAGAQVDARVYAPPVEAPVIDPFRPPAQPWLPGNRGIEYATVPGSLVRAIGPGVVVFAGPVAGQHHVTVAHPDGLRSSYSYLAGVRARVGDTVAGHGVLGVAGERFHVGVRRGEVYIDPASLWGQRMIGGRVRLVPTDGSGSAGPQRRSDGDPSRPATGGPEASLGSIGPGVARLGIGLARAVIPGGP